MRVNRHGQIDIGPCSFLESYHGAFQSYVNDCSGSLSSSYSDYKLD